MDTSPQLNGMENYAITSSFTRESPSTFLLDLSSATRQCLNHRRRANEDRVRTEVPQGDVDNHHSHNDSGNNAGHRRRR